MHNLLYCKIHIFICNFVWCSALVCLTLHKFGGARHKQVERERLRGRRIFLLIFAKITHHIEILVNFAIDSDEEEADAASQNQLLLMVDFCPLKRYIN